MTSTSASCYKSTALITDKDASTFPFFSYYIAAYVAIRIVKTLIQLRQLKRYQDTRPDARIARIRERQEFEDSQRFLQEKLKFEMIKELVDTMVELLLVGFWYVAIWDWINQLMSEHGLCSETFWIGDATQAFLFEIINYIIHQLIDIPFLIIFYFVTRERYRLNEMTPGLFLKDRIKEFFNYANKAVIFIPYFIYIYSQCFNPKM